MCSSLVERQVEALRVSGSIPLHGTIGQVWCNGSILSFQVNGPGSNPGICSIIYEDSLMSFDKNYPNRKDWRKPYLDSSPKSFDRTCRSGGSCPYCQRSRWYKAHKHVPLLDFDDFAEYTDVVQRIS